MQANRFFAVWSDGFRPGGEHFRGRPIVGLSKMELIIDGKVIPRFNLYSLMDGTEIVCDLGVVPLPAWLNDPLLRAMKTTWGWHHEHSSIT